MLLPLLKLLTIVSLCALTACTANSFRDLAGSAMGEAANAEVGYSTQQCFVVEQQCVEGHYAEWETSDGVPGCSCSK